MNAGVHPARWPLGLLAVANLLAVVGLFLMLLGSVRLRGWATIIVGGLGLAAWLLRSGERAATLGV